MASPPDFFSQLVKNFNINILPTGDVDVTVSYVNGWNEQRRIYEDEFLDASRGTRNQVEFYENILNRFFPRYIQMRNQLRQELRDDQIHALTNVIGLLPSSDPITYTRTTSAYDGIPGGIYGTSIYTRGIGTMYGGCSECYEFSMCFGGSSYEGKTIQNEEDFEIIKQKFVAHVNKEHRDIIAKKRETPHVNKKFEKVNKKPIILTSTPYGDNSFFQQEYNCTFTIQDESQYIDLRREIRETISNMYGVPIVQSPNTTTAGETPRHTAVERRGFRTRISNRHEV